ncbi:STAS domain-containing protein [Kibdelosporangium philippinense]|uniref:Anti-sigma factor antagonist n=1 Tax=Kibdelosporangium philippinense TaxID=211113 RepID=A0ABS8Z797_9PSEU|nr:STAS domain-containing protein [Kibdelosporangium philippinense]MCE7002938.1 STAS domain-containing protein [Kibdelosporangium philippinense]
MSENGLLNWHVEEDSDVVVLHIAGEIDLASEDDFAEALAHALDMPTPVVLVNLAEVTFLGSAALHVLLQANEEAHRRKQALRIAHGGSFAQRVLTVAGLDQVLDIYETKQSAMSWLPEPSDGRHDLGVRDAKR